MKKNLIILLILPLVLAFLAPKVKAQTLIQFWDFNRVRPISGVGTDSAGSAFSYTHTLGVDTTTDATWPLTADFTKVGLAAGHIVYSRPTKKIVGAATRDSDLAGIGPGGSYLYEYSNNKYSYFATSDSGFTEGNGFLKAFNPSDSCTLSLYIPTKGFENITMEYAMETSSPSAANYNVLSYSIDSGAHWKNLTTAMDTFNIHSVYMPDTLLMDNGSSHGNWYPVQINFSSDVSVNNNTKFVLRFMLTGPASTGASGNDRYDNIAVWGTSIPTSVNEITTNTIGCNLYPNPANTVLNINTHLLENQTASIYLYNCIGEMVKSEELKNGYTVLSITNLPDGIYLSRVIDNKGNLIQVDKIVIAH